MKRSPADIAFSLCVRERSDWICERCQRDFKHNRGSLHCSHVYTRGIRITRWSGMNAFAHCVGCHDYLGKNPLEFDRHFLEVRGEGQKELLMEKVRETKLKIPKTEEKLIAKHYREQLEEMDQKRKDGVTGWIEFVDYF